MGTGHLYLRFRATRRVWRDDDDTSLFQKTGKSSCAWELECLIRVVTPVICAALNWLVHMSGADVRAMGHVLLEKYYAIHWVTREFTLSGPNSPVYAGRVSI